MSSGADSGPRAIGNIEPRLKLWLESGDRIVMSDFRVELLLHIEESGSLARAADRMKLSYRRAWGKVKELETNLGFALVASEVGGAGGGQTRLTPEGAAFVRAYQAFHVRMQEELARAFAEELAHLGPPVAPDS